ncbi:hypothetical protein AYI69_g7170 [Smittium culicis]|uniref:Uncharacterized protein n=1 Tax=Smittium culicis TaxID=133412 RepID=A0A1R1XTX4_9FUNG|nr:hypothetical protein AYI69_g9530 [Smittium culicis]OMJ18092.1 hypothetical protein AYI69_g7170 [Smittium culicis]
MQNDSSSLGDIIQSNSIQIKEKILSLNNISSNEMEINKSLSDLLDNEDHFLDDFGKVGIPKVSLSKNELINSINFESYISNGDIPNKYKLGLVRELNL